MTALRRVARLTALAVVLIGLCAGAWGCAHSARAAAGIAIAPTGADAGDCRQDPCRTLAYAYRQASPGEAIEVAAGSYPGQSIPALSGRAAPAVEVRPAGDGRVVFGGLEIRGDHVLVRDIVTGDVDIQKARDAAVIGGRGRTLFLEAVSDVLIQGGSYGGNQDGPTVQIGASPASTDVTFDGVDFHDATATNPTVHMECLWAGGVQRLTVRNSLFRNCAYFAIFLTTLNGPDPRDVLLENNVFETTSQWNGRPAPYTVNVADWVTAMDGLVVRNNTFASDIAVQSATVRNARFVGNLGVIGSCAAGVTYSHNVWTSRTCGPTDRQSSAAMSPFVDRAAHDWRLKAGAVAVDAAQDSDAPATDRSGFRRGPVPDAGAYELGAPGPDPRERGRGSAERGR